MNHIDQLSPQALPALLAQFSKGYEDLKRLGLNLDLTRGKPSAEQLSLSIGLEGVAKDSFFTPDGTDTRNYGGDLAGLPEARALVAPILGVEANAVMVGDNSSLRMMYEFLRGAFRHGLDGPDSAWSKMPTKPKFICPVPGYDRHFRVCEDIGIEMIPVALNDDGPDMNEIESLMREDKSICGMWCVPKYSNPTGHVYSDQVVERIAALGKISGPYFRVIWDNAYAIHDIGKPRALANVMQMAKELGTEDSVVVFASFSKVTFAGAAIAFMGASPKNIEFFKKRQFVLTCGPDKLNQWRHVKFFKNLDNIYAHMQKHAAIVGPRFDIMLKRLDEGLTGTGMATWTRPAGGYFSSLDVLPGLAKEVVKLSAEAGVKLTPAGSTWPYGKDPYDSNIRLAPTYPKLEEVDKATQILVASIKLASVKQKMAASK